MGLKGLLFMAVLACATGCERSTSGTAAQDGAKIGVLAETATGQVPMPLFGKVERSRETLAIRVHVRVVLQHRYQAAVRSTRVRSCRGASGVRDFGT